MRHFLLLHFLTETDKKLSTNFMGQGRLTLGPMWASAASRVVAVVSIYNSSLWPIVDAVAALAAADAHGGPRPFSPPPIDPPPPPRMILASAPQT